MAFSVGYPLVLVFIPILVVFILFVSRNMTMHGKYKRNVIKAMRVLSIVLAIAGIAGVGIEKKANDTTTIFVVDGSDSMARSRIEAESFIDEAIKHKKPSDKVGMVVFGADSSVEFAVSDKPLYSTIQTKVNSIFTNIEDGLKQALSLIPAGDRKRIVLVTDGMENAGDSLKQARILKQQDIALDVFPISILESPEVQIEELSMPEKLRLNEKFHIGVKTKSTVKTPAVLKLFADRQLAAERNVEIAEGINNFVFTDIADKGGLVTYTAVIEPLYDTISKNNSISTFCHVEDAARVLVVQDRGEGASEIIKMLGMDIKAEQRSPESLPVSIEELQKYEAFIISDVTAEKLDDKFLENLETCIKYQGKGLLVTGGENSYAPGGYYKTVLEEVLPVNMDIKPKEEEPNLGLVLVIDKSGSMSEGQYGVSKVELAKEAAIRSTEVLGNRDMIGVIAFDSAVQWVVETQKIDNLDKIQDSIGTIRAGGGTQILSPLKEAIRSLKDADTTFKHIILLTDGHAEKSGYEPLIEDISEYGITLSTVAVGKMADIGLLGALAIGGNGRFYMTDEFTDIPKIFAKETFLAGKTYLNNRTFAPSLTSYSEILKGIDSIPQLDGYVGTTPKSTARVIFKSDMDDPVLAVWQYGLGRTAAWTPDARGMWTSSWLSWEQSPQFWNNLVSWLLQQRNGGDYRIKGGVEAGTGILELEIPPEEDMAGAFAEAVLAAPSSKEKTLAMEPVSPGLLRGEFGGVETGVYIASISVKKEGEVLRTFNSGISIPYSPEYRIPEDDASSFIDRLLYESGGRLVQNPADVFSGELAPVVGIIDITPILIALLIIIFFLEIALRRLNIPFEKLWHAVSRGTDEGLSKVRKAMNFVTEATGIEEIIARIAQKTGSGKVTPDSSSTKPDGIIKRANGIKQDAGMDGCTWENKEPGRITSSHISVLLEKKRRREKKP